MEARAIAKNVRCSPRKARLVLNLIRGMAAGDAMNLLKFTKKHVAKDVEKTLRSAIANAEGKSDTVDVDDLIVSEVFAGDGLRAKRMRPAPMGRGHSYVRRTCHITVKVAEKHPSAS
ncbi:MAG: 50S ribosomal protein L22 [Acidobacteria bacterium]|nr:50S ribosomal protein L22 [Acidobacteriota bacterium]